MYLTSLTLENFRSYEKKTFRFGSNTTLLVGDNATGKTNILEAIYLLAAGQSFRALKTDEMIRFNEPLARVQGIVGRDAERQELEVLLTRGELQGKWVAKRRYRIDEVPKRFSDFVGRLVVVVFRPEDLELILGSPSVRRAFMDAILSQIDREYRRSLFSYEKALVRRNRLLDVIREEGISRTQLAFWDQLIIKHGQVLTQKRMAFVETINRFDAAIDSFRVAYDSSVVSANRLLQYAEQEVAVGYTLVGPHKDDLIVTFADEKELALYGSRGEQRLAVLWLKLAELSFVTRTIGERPVLLLDDILSELDHEHRALVLKILPHQQTILTTTDLHLVGDVKEMEVLELHEGQKD